MHWQPPMNGETKYTQRFSVHRDAGAADSPLDNQNARDTAQVQSTQRSMGASP
jgi:hypothetical protein